MVDRWTLPLDFGGPEMTRAPGGEFVRYTDHDRLDRQKRQIERDVARLEKERNRERKHVARLMREKEELRTQSDKFRDKYLAALKRAETAERQLAERDAEVARVKKSLTECANYIASPLRLSDDNAEAARRDAIVGRARAVLAGSDDGWRLVPVETLEMLRGYILRSNNRWADGDIKTVNDLLFSAPASPSTAGER